MKETKGRREKNSRPLCYSSEEARTVLDSLSAHIAIVDSRGVILDTNRAWRDFAVKSGMPVGYDAMGANYLDICDGATGEAGAYARAVAAGIRDVIRGRMEEFRYDYPCHDGRTPHWFYLRAIRMVGEGPVRVVVSHEEITELKLTEEKLRDSQTQLTRKRVELEEANVALKVLLKQREGDKSELEQKVIANIKDLVMPYVKRLQRAGLKPKEKTAADIISTHLQDIISPMMQNLTHASIILTPQEIQVASLVKDGKASKEIADILNVSETTVHFHRKNLRTKFGLKKSRTNLRSYLISIS